MLSSLKTRILVKIDQAIPANGAKELPIRSIERNKWRRIRRGWRNIIGDQTIRIQCCLTMPADYCVGEWQGNSPLADCTCSVCLPKENHPVILLYPHMCLAFSSPQLICCLPSKHTYTAWFELRRWICLEKEMFLRNNAKNNSSRTSPFIFSAALMVPILFQYHCENQKIFQSFTPLLK